MRSRRGAGFQVVNKKYLLISTTVVLLFIVGTYFYYYSDSQGLKKRRTADLHTIALFKAEQVSHWYDERKANAVFYTTSPFSVDIYAKYVNEGSAKALVQINQRNRLIEGLYGFEKVFSVDLKRKEISEDGSDKTIMPSIIIKYIDSALIFRKIYTTNFYLTEPNRQPQNAIVAPVLNSQHEVLAVMVFYINPNKYLHNVKETISLLYKTAQFFLISPMGDSAISLPFSKERLTTQIEYSFIHSNEAKSILKDRSVYENRNTEGKRIVAIIEPVPNLPWYVINSIERSELFAEVNFRTLIFAIILFIAVFGFLISLYFLTLEQKARHELMLKTSEQERYFNNSIDMLCIADTNGYFRLLNPEWGKVLGYSISELEGRKFLDFVHPEDVEKTIENATKLANNQIVTRFENRYQHKDGSYRWIEWRSYPFEKLIYASARDITARKYAEEEVRKTELWLRDSQHNSHIGSFNYDIVNDIWKSSEELDTIFGISDDYDKTSTGWLKLIHPEHQKEMTEHLMNHVIRQHHNFDKEYRIIRQNDGEVRWVHGLGNLVFSKEGILELMIGTIQDINDKKNTELALLKEERKYRLLFENMTSGFALHEMIYDDSGNPQDYRYIEINPAFEKLTGVSANALIGHTVKEVLPNIEEHWINTFGNVAKTGEAISYMNYAHELGKYYDTYAFSPEKDKFAVMFNDATNRVKAENLLRESEARLRSFIDGSFEGIAIINETGIVEEWNKSAETILKISKQDIIHKYWNDVVKLLYPADMHDVESFDQIFKEALETGNIKVPSKNTYSKLFPNGLKYFEQTIFTIKTDAGHKIAIIFNDITERINTESALNQARTFTDALLGSIPGLVYMYSEEGYLFRWNKRHEDETGYSSEELWHWNILDWFKGSESDIAAITAGLGKLYTEGYGTAEAFLQKKNGEKVLYYFTAIATIIDGKKYFTGIGIDITERKNAELALKKSEAILKATMESMDDGVLVVSSGGTITHSNPRFSQIFSIPDELFSSKDDIVILSYVKQQLIDPDDFERQVVEIYQSDKSTEDILRFKDGRIIERFSYPLMSELPLQGRVWLFRDITERQRTEELIAYERNMLRILIDNINDLVYIKDTESRFLIANNALAKTLNITVEEMMGKTDLELFSYEIAVDFYNDERNLFATGIPIINKEEKIIDIHGNDILFQTNKLPLRDASGSIIGLVGSGHVITEQKKYEEALQKRVLALTKPLNDPEEIEFTDLFNLDELQKIQDTFADATGVASIITSPDGKPITKASNFCKLCNIIRSTKVGSINCNKSDAYLGKQAYNGPTIKLCLSGGLWDASASITVGGIHVANWLIGQVRNETQSEKEMLKYADTIGIDREEFKKALNDVPSMPQDQFNRVANALFILANELSLKAYQNIQQARFISDQKQSEQQIKKLNEELEKKVEERTIRLQELNKELESFAYSISHDLRAPIRHVDGFVRLLYSNIEAPTEVAKGYYEKINSASKRMSGMIDELLAFSRLGRREITVSKVNLNNIINEIIEQAKPDISHRNILWEIKPLPTIAVDHNVIKIAFENLISNAIKYTSKKPEAIIEIGCAEETPEKVVIYFKDNGAGFDMAFADKLFGVFQRLHSSEEFEGTGIGLASVKQIISKHKGTVSAQSKVNEGATFYVTLPK